MDDKIKKKIIIYNITTNIISSVILVAIITILMMVFKNKIIDYIEIINIGYILMVLYCLFSCFIEPFIDIRTWSYKITDKKVEYTKGLISLSKTVIPMSRIQQVTIINGPILNVFGLVRVEILTTINTHHIKNITITQGNEIVNEISDMLYSKSKTKSMDETVGEEKNEEK